MKRQAYDIKLDICIEAPYLVHGNDAGRYGIDATLLTDHLGRPVLPGTLLAGRIVEVWHNLGQLLGDAKPENWFGTKGAVQGARARLKVADLVLNSIKGQAVNQLKADTAVSRIRQSRDTAAVEQGGLFLTEQIAQPGAELRFAGIWRTWAAEPEIATLLAQLKGALLLQTQLGAYRSVGFGRVRTVEVQAQQSPVRSLQLVGGQERYRLALSSNEALCVGSRSKRGNVFESSDVLSGGTILGTIATMLAAQHGQPNLSQINTSLARNFSLLHCSHALPSKVGYGRPSPLPQSLVSYDGQIYDAWQQAQAPVELNKAPAFQTDWKAADFDKAQLSQCWGETLRYLRIRTDIDGNGVAKDSSLFGYESVVAPQDNQQAVTTNWLFDLDLQAIPAGEREAVRQELAQLLGHGLFPVGKTDAFCTVQCAENDSDVWPAKTLHTIQTGDLVPILLSSDALLFPTSEIADNPAVDLLGIYQGAFADLLQQAGSVGALQLSHFFATQRLTGGNYLHGRFHRNKPYQPWVLTEAGSVFVFKVNDAQRARDVLQRWAATGLPLTAAVKTACGAGWETNPYVPQNGFGEVQVAPEHKFPALPIAQPMGA